MTTIWWVHIKSFSNDRFEFSILQILNHIPEWTLKREDRGDFGDADVHDDEIDDDGGDGGDTDGEDDEINFELEAIVVDEISEDEEDKDIDFIRRNDYWTFSILM